MSRKSTGEIGEEIARNLLKKKGYLIREQNFRCSEGEIDIIAEKKKNLVFVEVRTKSTGEFGIPEESITSAKKERLIKTAFSYLAVSKKTPPSWRIDFIGIELNGSSKASRIVHIENAVQG